MGIEGAFVLPSNWTPGKQPFFRGQRYPRKLKKQATQAAPPHLTLPQKMWYALWQRNQAYARFLIRAVTTNNEKDNG